MAQNSEQKRMLNPGDWKKWGPYLTERQWGTVREDYSADGEAWEHTTHDNARSLAYRWGEEGLAGISDSDQLLCFAVAMWNGKDPILKERLFGLTGREGNHGEDVKELYYYLDNTPTHSFMKMLYKYPQSEFPYKDLLEQNRHRGKDQPEYELIDTGSFDANNYFDVFIEYAKATPQDILMQIRVINRSAAAAKLHMLPTLWFRNTWIWQNGTPKPNLKKVAENTIQATHPDLGQFYLYSKEARNEILFCENETNVRRLYDDQSAKGTFKDGVNDYILTGNSDALNTDLSGTKAALHFKLNIKAGAESVLQLRLSDSALTSPFRGFEQKFKQRQTEADLFYGELQNDIPDSDKRRVQRQAFAGLLWTKQFYYYDIDQWLNGDNQLPAPPQQRQKGRNNEWIHLNNSDIISMPDKWEYPWYAAWDLAFHCVPLAMIDAEYAKNQLVLLTREWYMHPNGQLPAYEWNFSDVNPPVHAWATWRVYKIEQKIRGGKGDLDFLERVFHKMLLNFTWWVNRKDAEGNNVFQGGFLGLDNIGVFDRSKELPTGGHLEQTDGTSWMAMFALNMMRISLELAAHKPVYQDMASKFFEHFLYIAGAMTNYGGSGINLWDEEDEFYYDVLHSPNGQLIPLKIRSMVGLIPLFAVETIEPDFLEKVPEFKSRLEWFLEYRPDLASLVSRWFEPGKGERRLLSLLRGHRMKMLLRRMLDETEFLSDYGIRALSKYHQKHPYTFHVNGAEYKVEYQPAESDSAMFGGNSNWRGPIWFPVNYLIIESLQKFHHYYGDDFKVEYPTGTGKFHTLARIADELGKRLTRIFLEDKNGNRPVFGDHADFHNNPGFKDHILFYEYFHGDTGRGVGASHQTGWTGLVAKLLQPRIEK